MKVTVTTIALTELDVDLLLVPTAKEGTSEAITEGTRLFGPGVERAQADITGALGQSVLIYPEQSKAKRAAFLGLGDADFLTADSFRKAAAFGADLAAKVKAETVAVVVPPSELFDAEISSQAFVEGFMLASYQFRTYKTKPADFTGAERFLLHTDGELKSVRKGSDQGRIVSEAVMTARDLVNLSPDEKTPELLSRHIERLGKKYDFDVSVWDKDLIAEEKMGGLLAVNRGSQDPPTFSVLTWQPENAKNKKPVVLVGKGVTFDTGGLSLKPTKDSMDHMKADMAGAAAVVGTMEALARLKIPVYVVGLIPATDNRPGEKAYVPGDVVRMHSGKTVEVLNTDAEGRMILADALSYAKTYRPDLVIDLATLTGAVVYALGSDVSAVMTNSRGRARKDVDALIAASHRSGDRLHPLPMYKEYAELLESDVADIKNVGGREAGSITAAKFLEHFVEYPWIHLDIAGTAFLQKPKPYRGKGGTGFGVRVLVEFLRSYS
ncbi:MAG: leucyl aminopeptidase [Bacteroidota bacterium]